MPRPGGHLTSLADRRTGPAITSDDQGAEAADWSRRPQAGAAARNRRLKCAQCDSEVWTSAQLGSVARVLRAKVHTSVTAVTWFASPSTTSPAALRVTFTCSETNFTVTKAVRP